MSVLAKVLALIAAGIVFLGVVALAVIMAVALASADGLSLLAIPIVVLGLVVVLALLLVFAVIGQGIRDLRDPPAEDA